MSKEIEKEVTRWATLYVVPSEYNESGFTFHMDFKYRCKEERDKSDWDNDPEDWVFLCEEEYTMEVPTFDMREKLLESLQGTKRRKMAEYQKEMASIDDRISKLTALEVLSEGDGD